MARTYAARVAGMLALALFGGGCASHGQYLVEEAALTQLGAHPAGARETVVPAVRVSDQKRVWVKASALQLDATKLAAEGRSGPISVEARGSNPMVTAGSVLTWIGTAISLAGTVLVAASSDLRLAGALTALSAEPIMWTGTGLWIAGLTKPAYEVAPRRADYDYLDAGKPPEPALPPTRSATLRISF